MLVKRDIFFYNNAVLINLKKKLLIIIMVDEVRFIYMAICQILGIKLRYGDQWEIYVNN